ncbi:MAG: rhomboid family intramembrane serine protease [Pirellulales bacterium]
MGLDDREYARDSESGFQLGAPQSMVGGLILLNIALWLLDVFSDGRLSQRFDLSATLTAEPWNFWQLVTYGFLHDYRSVLHILGNMLMLFVFGRELETTYGKWEFFRIYLTAIVLGGIAFVLWRNFVLDEPWAQLVGASAAVSTVVVLFALHYPNRQVLVFGVLPTPVWALAAIIVVINIMGMAGRRDGATTAYEAHVAGILFAFGYHRFGWNLGRLIPGGDRWSALPRRFGRRADIKLHEPEEEPQPLNLSAETDRILAKIHTSGYDSLTEEERRTLERARHEPEPTSAAVRLSRVTLQVLEA